MKAYTPHHSVRWLTFVSAPTQFSDHGCPSRLFCSGLAALLVPLDLCSLAHLPSQGRAVQITLFRSLSVLELSCLLKTARIYFRLIRITLVSGNFTFMGITGGAPRSSLDEFSVRLSSE